MVSMVNHVEVLATLTDAVAASLQKALARQTGSSRSWALTV